MRSQLRVSSGWIIEDLNEIPNSLLEKYANFFIPFEDCYILGIPISPNLNINTPHNPDQFLLNLETANLLKSAYAEIFNTNKTPPIQKFFYYAVY